MPQFASAACRAIRFNRHQLSLRLSLHASPLRHTPLYLPLSRRYATEVEAGPVKPNTLRKDAQMRINQIEVQQLSDVVYRQVFPGVDGIPDVPPDLVKLSIEHLQHHELYGKTSDTSPPIGFELPPLIAGSKNLSEHFHWIGMAVAQPYLAIAKRLAEREIPSEPYTEQGDPEVILSQAEMDASGNAEHGKKLKERAPKPMKKKMPHAPGTHEWVLDRPGWTKYVVGEAPVPVDSPGDEEMLVFDVETLYKHSQFAVMACAASPTAWYSWISPWLLELEGFSDRQLIPMGDPTKHRIIVGHNIGYDRARIKEEYNLTQTNNAFIDTMSLHVAVNGMCSRQRPTWIKHRKNAELREKISLEAPENLKAYVDGSGEEEELWIGKSSINSLKDVAEFHLDRIMDKEARNYFGTLDRKGVRTILPTLFNYCASDVSATFGVYKEVLKGFLEVCPHPVSFSALRHLSSVILPVNQGWETYINKAEGIYRQMSDAIQSKLLNLVELTAALSEDERKGDDWLEQLDWTVEEIRWLKPKKKPKKPKKPKKIAEPPVKVSDLLDSAGKKKRGRKKKVPDPPVEAAVDPEPTEPEPVDPEPTEPEPVDPEPTEPEPVDPEPTEPEPVDPDTLPRQDTRQKLPGKPQWYRDLVKKQGAGPTITVRSRAAGIVLKLSWDGYPLVWSDKHGWTFKVPKDKAEGYKEMEKNAVQCEFEDDDKPARLKEDKDNIYFKVPHKDGPTARCVNPLSKNYVKPFEDGRLSSKEPFARDALDMNAQCSYWISSRERITSQMMVYQDEIQKMGVKHVPTVDVNNSTVTTVETDSASDGTAPNVKTSGEVDLTPNQTDSAPEDASRDIQDRVGFILPQLIPMGTVTRRAVERTWLTASNAKKNRVGSELKSMVTAPPGYHFVGADVDSQELWIASLVGDAQLKLHGGTALGFMTLEGTKSAGTDLHSKTAKILGISRNSAKIFNYGRIYGAGIKFATSLLKQFNPSISDAEAAKTAENLYKATKGEKLTRKTTRLVENSFWFGGSESFVFNRLEEFANQDRPRTPVLGAGITEALMAAHLSKGGFMTSRINWAIQSSGVDYLHLLVTSMDYLIRKYKLGARLAITVHDEIRYLVKSEDRYRAAMALQVANVWTRAMFSMQMGINDLPQSCAYFSAVDIDRVLRKEVDMDCITPSNPNPIPPGESVDIFQLLDKGDEARLDRGDIDTTLDDEIERLKDDNPYQPRTPVMQELAEVSGSTADQLWALKAQMSKTTEDAVKLLRSWKFQRDGPRKTPMYKSSYNGPDYGWGWSVPEPAVKKKPAKPTAKKTVASLLKARA